MNIGIPSEMYWCWWLKVHAASKKFHSRIWCYFKTSQNNWKTLAILHNHISRFLYVEFTSTKGGLGRWPCACCVTCFSVMRKCVSEMIMLTQAWRKLRRPDWHRWGVAFWLAKCACFYALRLALCVGCWRARKITEPPLNQCWMCIDTLLTNTHSHPGLLVTSGKRRSNYLDKLLVLFLPHGSQARLD